MPVPDPKTLAQNMYKGNDTDTDFEQSNSALMMLKTLDYKLVYFTWFQANMGAACRAFRQRYNKLGYNETRAKAMEFGFEAFHTWCHKHDPDAWQTLARKSLEQAAGEGFPSNYVLQSIRNRASNLRKKDQRDAASQVDDDPDGTIVARQTAQHHQADNRDPAEAEPEPLSNAEYQRLVELAVHFKIKTIHILAFLQIVLLEHRRATAARNLGISADVAKLGYQKMSDLCAEMRAGKHKDVNTSGLGITFCPDAYLMNDPEGKAIRRQTHQPFADYALKQGHAPDLLTAWLENTDRGETPEESFLRLLQTKSAERPEVLTLRDLHRQWRRDLQ